MILIDLISLAGLVCGIWGSFILVNHIFITDKEIEKLSAIPLEASNTNMTNKDCSKNLPVALTDVTAILDYRNMAIENRKIERGNGKKGLRWLMIGFILQAIPPIFNLANSISMWIRTIFKFH